MTHYVVGARPMKNQVKKTVSVTVLMKNPKKFSTVVFFEEYFFKSFAAFEIVKLDSGLNILNLHEKYERR